MDCHLDLYLNLWIATWICWWSRFVSKAPVSQVLEPTCIHGSWGTWQGPSVRQALCEPRFVFEFVDCHLDLYLWIATWICWWSRFVRSEVPVAGRQALCEPISDPSDCPRLSKKAFVTLKLQLATKMSKNVDKTCPKSALTRGSSQNGLIDSTFRVMWIGS